MMTEHVVTVEREAPNNNAAPNKHAPPNNDQPLSWIKINLDYFKTTPGLLKIAEVVLGIFCMALASPAYVGGTHFFLLVATVSFIGTLIWVFIYLLGIREAISFPIDWILTELVNTSFVTLFYFIAFIVQLVVTTTHLPYHYYRRGAQITAGVFGIFNTLVYAFATYLLHIEWKASRTT